MWYVIAGIAAGLLGGMGMGGGTVLIPILTLFFTMGQHESQAINLLTFLPMAAVSLFIHFKNKLVHTRGILLIIIPAVAVGILSSFLAHKADSKLLSSLFGGFLVLLGIYQGICAFRKRKEE